MVVIDWFGMYVVDGTNEEFEGVLDQKILDEELRGRSDPIYLHPNENLDLARVY